MTVAEDVARVPLSGLLRRGRAVAVLRADDASRYDAVVDVLVAEGITAIELTLTTPGTTEALPRLAERYAGRAEVGVGTVVSVEQAVAVLGAGAAFVVTPIVQPEVVAVVRDASVPVFPGAMSPTEVATAWSAGASAVKIFPASTVGPGHLRALHGPFPELSFIPSGGVAVDDIGTWLQAGATAVSLGGELLGDALRGGDLALLRDRASRCRRLLDEHGTSLP